MHDFVDIILPNYNSSDTIEQTIKSITNQSYKYWKLIIVDDNSDCKTKKILKKFNNIKKISIIHNNKNYGAAYCRNLGLKRAKSKYIAFIDSDDIWKKNKLKKQIDYMNTNKINFSYTWYETFNKNKLKKISTPIKFNYRSFIKNTSIATSSMIIRRSCCIGISFTKTKICEDYYFKCLLLKKCKFAYCLNEYLTKYRIRKNSLQSNRLKNLFWIWNINKKLNKLSFFENLNSIIQISINSIKKYGLRLA
jgi:teichuronic acid biosynthesis glycosyltransferase TuaG